MVITTHEGWSFTQRCLEHLANQTVTHEVIVSDGASTDGTPEKIQAGFPDVKVISHHEDPGYAAATNDGVAAGSADVVVLLNNDTFCRPDFLERILAAFEDPSVGLVAPVTVRVDERTLDGVGITLDRTLAPFIRLSGRPLDDAAGDMPLLVLPGGGADAYRRAAWAEAGGFEERLRFYGADVDLGLRIRTGGWRAVAATRAIAVHVRSATSGHRSRRARNSGGWARGFLLRRWSVLKGSAALRAVVTETLVVLADMALSHDTIAIRSRVDGWRCAGELPPLEVPPGCVDESIGFVESLRLRWASR